MKSIKFLFVIITACIPLALVFFQEKLSCIFSVSESHYFEIVKAILPLIFSIIVLLINSILTDRKDNREIRRNELIKNNKKVEKYNLLFLNSKKMYHSRIRYLRQSAGVVEHFFQIPELQKAYSDWIESLKINVDGSNNDLIRNELREKLLTLVNRCCETTQNLNYFELLSNSKLYLLNSRTIDEDQEIFISQFANDDISDFLDKNIVLASAEILSYGGSSDHAIEQYNDSVDQLKTILSGETTSKVFYDKTYGVCINLLFLVECLITDLNILERGLRIFSEQYQGIYQSQKREFPEIDTAFSISKFDIPADVEKYFHDAAVLRKYGLLGPVQ